MFRLFTNLLVLLIFCVWLSPGRKPTLPRGGDGGAGSCLVANDCSCSHVPCEGREDTSVCLEVGSRAGARRRHPCAWGIARFAEERRLISQRRDLLGRRFHRKRYPSMSEGSGLGVSPLTRPSSTSRILLFFVCIGGGGLSVQTPLAWQSRTSPAPTRVRSSPLPTRAAGRHQSCFANFELLVCSDF